MELAILNYGQTPSVELHKIPDDTEDVEEYIITQLDYSLDQIAWLSADKIVIDDMR
jgi:hypothetical protein